MDRIYVEEWVEAGCDGDEFACRDCLAMDPFLYTSASTRRVADVSEKRQDLTTNRLLCGVCAYARGAINLPERRRWGQDMDDLGL